MAFFEKNTVLVVFVKDAADLVTAQNNLWYRIPLLHTPLELLTGQIQTLAFYSRMDGKLAVRHFGTVQQVKTLKRKDLLPAEAQHPRAEQDYCKVELTDFHCLPQPIPSRSNRWFLTLPTTETLLFQAREINDLFNDSPLENLLYQAFQQENIPCERQYHIPIGKSRFFLDFAVLCNKGKLNIECDGREFHSQEADLEYDRLRDQVLKAMDWMVLRLPAQMLRYQTVDCLNIIRYLVEQLGGLPPLVCPSIFSSSSQSYGWSDEVHPPDC